MPVSVMKNIIAVRNIFTNRINQGWHELMLSADVIFMEELAENRMENTGKIIDSDGLKLHFPTYFFNAL